MEETVLLTIVTATAVNVPRESGAKTVPKVPINFLEKKTKNFPYKRYSTQFNTMSELCTAIQFAPPYNKLEQYLASSQRKFSILQL